MYPSAIIGTITPLTRAMRRMPPKMMSSVSAVSTTPTHTRSAPKVPSHAAQIVLLCTELKANPKVTEISTANSTPIHLRPRPRSM